GALVRTFYQRFLPKQTGLSKAQALQSAQLQVMKDPAWKHPKYWAPFTVIGNWLTGEERLRIYRELDLKAVQPSGRLN
ncbi:MAG: CHAT domain-containing protein, partial [Verrucomicrobiales bacterium]